MRLRELHIETRALVVFSQMFWLSLLPMPTRCQDSSGTTAVVIWTPEQIVLAVDSKVLRRNDPFLSSYTRCKILQVGRFFVVAAGLYDRDAIGFHAWDLMRAAALKGNSVKSVADLTERSLRPALEAAIADASIHDPQSLERYSSHDYLTFFVAGIDDGELVVEGRDFFPDKPKTFQIDEILPLSGDVFPDTIDVNLFGETDAISKRYPDRRALLRLIRGDAVRTAKQLVELEISEHPEKVGGPVSVLAIDRRGHRWVEPGACADDKPF